MAKLTGIIDEPVSSGGQDHLDISVHTKSLIRFIRENKHTYYNRYPRGMG